MSPRTYALSVDAMVLASDNSHGTATINPAASRRNTPIDLRQEMSEMLNFCILLNALPSKLFDQSLAKSCKDDGLPATGQKHSSSSTLVGDACYQRRAVLVNSVSGRLTSFGCRESPALAGAGEGMEKTFTAADK